MSTASDQLLMMAMSRISPLDGPWGRILVGSCGAWILIFGRNMMWLRRDIPVLFVIAEFHC